MLSGSKLARLCEACCQFACGSETSNSNRSRSIRSQEQTLYAWTEKRSKEASVWDQTFRIGIWRLSRVERRETELHCALARLPKAVVDFVANRLDGRL